MIGKTATVYLDRSSKAWRYRTRAGNGETLDPSQPYTRRLFGDPRGEGEPAGCPDDLRPESVRRQGADDPRRTGRSSAVNDAPPLLHRTASVMHLVHDEDGEPSIGAYAGARHVVVLDRDVFLDLGNPDTITVTVEPGDTLTGRDPFGT